jgi:hypothetical protein
MVLDAMTGIVIKANTHRGPTQIISRTTMIIMTIDDIKLHQLLASMKDINAWMPITFFWQMPVTQRKSLPQWGGTIESPSNSVNQRSARNCRVSHLDAAALADRDYHDRVDGFDLLTITVIKNCGYSPISSDDVLLCYRDFIQLHCKTLGGGVNARTLQCGPLVKRIVEKALPLFKKLDGVTAAELVYFYDEFNKTASVYLLPFMPFYANSIKLGFEGFCPPGIGIHRYADVATALMDILPRVMPEQISRLGKLIVVIQADSNNGYYLMWRVMALGVPGFDPTLHVASLVWEDCLDIFNFCRAHILYFCPQAKQEL